MEMKAEELVTMLSLSPHPSACAGWFRETFRDSKQVETAGGTRAASTTIYFLQKKGMKSGFHRLRSSEVIHHYQGVPLVVYQICPTTGKLERFVLGKDYKKGERPQVVIPGDNWFAQRIEEGSQGDWCLTGVMVAPGWDMQDMDIPPTEELVKLFPAHEQIIRDFGSRD